MPTPTHAGGIVVKKTGADLLYLLVTARAEFKQWVLPKGHIRPGETPEDAAKREIREEAGVVGEVMTLLGTVEFSAGNERVQAMYYLMYYIGSTSEREPDRQIAWYSFDEAIKRLSFVEAADLLRKAHALMVQ